MKTLNKIIVPFCIALMLSACSPAKKISLENLNYLYRENLDSHLISKAYRLNDSSYAIYLETVRHDPELPRLKINEGSLVKYTIYGGQKKEEYFVEDSVRLGAPEFQAEAGKFEIALPGKGEYLLNLKSPDAGGRLYASLLVLNNNPYSQDNFLALDTSARPLLFPYLDRQQSIHFETNFIHIESFPAYYYDREFPPALPPFIFKKAKPYMYSPDSVFSIGLQEGMSEAVEVSKKGFYHFMADSSRREGYTIFLFDDGFPGINSAADMLAPLRYISSDGEYNKMKYSEDLRLAIEEFWLKLKGNIERARFAIKRYYSRVEDANILFSSYLPGWKSDRGMIYIVYGPPSSVSYGDGYEVWTYGEPKRPNALRLEFVKVDNPFTENDFQLVRSPNFKESWYFNIDNWRR